MNLLFYHTINNEAGERLRKIITILVPEEQTEIYTTIDSLSFRLRQPIFDVDPVILLASSKAEFLEILALRDLLRNVRIIFILPDREEDTILEGLKIFPRYMTYADGDFMDVAAVLRKILGYKHSKINKQKRGEKR